MSHGLDLPQPVAIGFPGTPVAAPPMLGEVPVAFAATAAPGKLAHRLPRRCAAYRGGQGQPGASDPPRPPTRAPSLVRGTCGGILKAVGRKAAHRFVVQENHPPTPSQGRGHAHPPPARGRERESERGGSVLRQCPERDAALLQPPSLRRHGIRPSRTAQCALAPSQRRWTVNGREGPIAKGTVVVISNTRRFGREGERRRPRSCGPCGASRPRTRRRTWARAATSTSSGSLQNNNYEQGRRDRLRVGLHRRGDRLPRQPRPRCEGSRRPRP